MRKAKLRKRQGRPKSDENGLDRRHIAAEAFALLEEEGLAALTMRRLAERLGVSPMALYNHVADKADLLQGVAEALVNQANFDGGGGLWHERIRRCFRELRRVCRAHPQASRLLETLDAPPREVFRPMEITLEALRTIGLEDDNALRAFYLLVNFTLGQSAYEARGPSKGLDPRWKFENGMGESSSEPARWDYDEAFEFGLTTILAGLSSTSRTA